jgi:hypothetical protein
MEPGHVSNQKLPTEHLVGLKDPTPESEYPKVIRHPIRGEYTVKDADEEKMILAEIDEYNAKVNAPEDEDEDEHFAFADEVKVLTGRELTDTEKAFCAEIEAAATKQHALSREKMEALTGGPEVEQEPDETLKIETKEYADGSSATGVAPLPDVSPEGAPVASADATGVPATPIDTVEA